jgi:RNA polymerase sigma factor (sigma-70 family)
VFGVCRRILKDTHHAEDAFQAAFLVLSRKADSLRDPERLAPWLYGVAYRIALKARRTYQRLPLQFTAKLEETDSHTPNSGAEDCLPCLDEAIHALPARYREPIVLCYFEGLTNTEAANRIGCPWEPLPRLARPRDASPPIVARGFIIPATLLLALLERAATGAITAGVVADCHARQHSRARRCGNVTLMEGATSVMKIKMAQRARHIASSRNRRLRLEVVSGGPMNRGRRYRDSPASGQ